MYKKLINSVLAGLLLSVMSCFAIAEDSFEAADITVGSTYQNPGYYSNYMTFSKGEKSFKCVSPATVNIPLIIIPHVQDGKNNVELSYFDGSSYTLRKQGNTLEVYDDKHTILSATDNLLKNIKDFTDTTKCTGY